jgi:hypothetical protein
MGSWSAVNDSDVFHQLPNTTESDTCSAHYNHYKLE